MTTLKNTDPFAQIVSKNPRMQDVIEKAKKFALLDVPLLIQGETGTGKDVIAKACHDLANVVIMRFWLSIVPAFRGKMRKRRCLGVEIKTVNLSVF